MKRKIRIYGMAAGLLWLSLAPAGARAAAPDLDLGGRIYAERCKVCHGEAGGTNEFAAAALNPPPRNFTTAAARQELSRARMIRSVSRGRPGTAMMPWRGILSGEEIRAVVGYIRHNFMRITDE